jgi:hypothetical protein
MASSCHNRVARPIWPQVGSELQREMKEAGLFPARSPEIEAGTDEADLVAYPMRKEGGLRVVEDDAFLAVDQARPTHDTGKDGIEPEDGDLVRENHLLCVEDLALPGEDVNELGDLGRVGGARREDRRPLRLAVWNGPGFDAHEEIVELGLGHRQQLCDIVGHCGSPLQGYESFEQEGRLDNWW